MTADNEAKAEQMRIAYGRVFLGPKGEPNEVLIDLLRAFGMKHVEGLAFIEQQSAIPGMRNEEVWMREGMKQPLRHILATLAKDTKTEPKPKEAQT